MSATAGVEICRHCEFGQISRVSVVLFNQLYRLTNLFEFSFFVHSHPETELSKFACDLRTIVQESINCCFDRNSTSGRRFCCVKFSVYL